MVDVEVTFENAAFGRECKTWAWKGAKSDAVLFEVTTIRKQEHAKLRVRFSLDARQPSGVSKNCPYEVPL